MGVSLSSLSLFHTSWPVPAPAAAVTTHRPPGALCENSRRQAGGGGAAAERPAAGRRARAHQARRRAVVARPTSTRERASIAFLSLAGEADALGDSEAGLSAGMNGWRDERVRADKMKAGAPFHFRERPPPGRNKGAVVSRKDRARISFLDGRLQPQSGRACRIERSRSSRAHVFFFF